MTGTELKIVTPAETEILGPEVDRLPTLHTNARTDRELLEVWLKSNRDGSAHTVRVYARVGELPSLCRAQDLCVGEAQYTPPYGRVAKSRASSGDKLDPRVWEAK